MRSRGNMPFPRETRERALVAAARHCCVCHRYKGVNIEVHHIVTEADAGADDFDNAIPLCFDCHAAVGHYNPKHPRGSRLSGNELRQHRDTWYQIVRRNTIEAPNESGKLYCRYLMCSDYTAFREITRGEFQDIPVTQPFLFANDVQAFHIDLIRMHPHEYRGEEVWGDAFKNPEAFALTHPSVPILEKSNISVYPYFEAIRIPSFDEIRDRVAREDGLTRVLVEAGIPAADICAALAYTEICGEDRFQEIYQVRPFYALYLAATNTGEQLVTLTHLRCQREAPPGVGYRLMGSRGGDEAILEMPGAPLPPGATAVLPVASLVGPLAWGTDSEGGEEIRYDLPNGQTQVLSEETGRRDAERTAVIGPAAWPLAVEYRIGGILREQTVHQFNIGSLYVLSRYWEAGCCPHLFAVSISGEVRYVRELFARSPSVMHKERITVRHDTKWLIVTELEAETTVIEGVEIDGTAKFGRMILTQGEHRHIFVEHCESVVLQGRYEAQARSRIEPLRKNELVREFMRRIQRRRQTEPLQGSSVGEPLRG